MRKAPIILISLLATLLSLGGCKTYYPPAPQPFVDNPVPPKPAPTPAPAPPSVLPSSAFADLPLGLPESDVVARVGSPLKITLPDQQGFYYWHYKSNVNGQLRDAELQFKNKLLTGVEPGF